MQYCDIDYNNKKMYTYFNKYKLSSKYKYCQNQFYKQSTHQFRRISIHFRTSRLGEIWVHPLLDHRAVGDVDVQGIVTRDLRDDAFE